MQLEHLIDFEALKAVPDQLVTYFFWAEDFGPDGKPRRTEGDMYFAEVRHFEEIFRQGEQPSSGSAEDEQDEQGGGNAQQAEQLAELQKEIINGTWKADPPRDRHPAHRQVRPRHQDSSASRRSRLSTRPRPARGPFARRGLEGEPGERHQVHEERRSSTWVKPPTRRRSARCPRPWWPSKSPTRRCSS